MRIRGSAIMVLIVATIAVFTDSFIYGCLVPYTTIYSTDFKLNDEQVGLVMAAYALTLVIFTPVAGK
jgi:MFS family permease